MDIERAQRDLFTSYAGGAGGVLVSGLVWLAAGLVLAARGVQPAFVTLFFGGMLIHPGGLLVSRLILRAPVAARGNPLERLAIESTIVLFAGILIGYLMLRVAPALSLPVVALIIGARYVLFRTMYGDALYWGLGGAIMAVACAGIFGPPIPPAAVPLLVGGVELVFALLLYRRWARTRA